MRFFIFISYLSFLLTFSLQAELKYLLKNSFSFPEDEIYFGRLSPPKFKYSVSSCILEEYCGHNLFDSNPSSDWTAIKESNEEWILIDFGSKRLMNRIQLEVSRLSDPIPTVDIQVKHRDEWKTISSYNFPRGKQIFEIGSLDASIIRIFFPKRTASVISISGLTVLLNENILTGIDSKYTGYIFPIKNGLIPDNDYGLPGAPRKYRNGVHKGLDISFVLDKDNKQIPLTMDTPIRAIQDGYIVRADLNYEPMTLKDYEDITTYNQSHPVTYVDKDFGGRQIWIDHRNGVMSSNNHMSKIAKGLKIGSYVKKGQIIGNVGNSGLKPEALGTKDQIHLHLEIWIDGEFLGNDLSPHFSRKFLQFFFSE